MKLTPLGKLVLGCVALAVVGIGYLLFFKPAEVGPDYTVPAQLSFNPRKIASSTAADAAYRARTTKAVSYCNFFSGYRANRGKPIRFDAYIPGDYTKSLYYYEDPKTGEQYIPAYFIAPGGSGLSLARSFAEDSFDRLPTCAPAPEQGGSGGVVLLGFPKGRVPQGQYVKAYGEMWWDSINLNPAQTQTTEGAATAPAPVVKIATFDRLTTSQASDPANVTFPMNIAVQRGPGIIRVSRLEFADNETRVWVELINLTAKSLPPWSGSTRACLRPEGDACIVAGTTTQSDTGSNDEGSDNQVANDDRLAPDAPIPPGSSGSTLSGYLTFSRLDPGGNITLELPDFSQDSADSPTPSITIQLPNERTAQSTESNAQDEKLAGSGNGG